MHKILSGFTQRGVKSDEDAIAKRMNMAYAKEDIASIKKEEIDGIFSRLASINNPHSSYEKRKALLDTAIQWSRKYDYPNKKNKLNFCRK